jgi:sugar phosphate isomerase/epimerase
LEPDSNCALEQLTTFADMSSARDLRVTLEFLPGLPIGDLAAAVAAVRAVGRAHFQLLLDAMHVFRSGANIAQLAALDPALIGYAQLCDVPWISRLASYADEARHERLPPGEGELPLADFVSVLPRDLIVGLEIPMLGRAERGMSPHDRLTGCVAAARNLLARGAT